MRPIGHSNKMMTIRLISIFLVTFFLAGCTPQKGVRDITYDPTAANPTRKPTYNATVLEEAIQCFNKKLHANLKQPVRVASDEIFDRAGTKVEGGREFVISGLNRLNAEGRLITSDWTTNVKLDGVSGVISQKDPSFLQLNLPTLTIRGAITQSHSAERAKQGAGINIAAVIGGGQSETKAASSIALDLRLINTRNQEVLTTSSNVISISASSTDSNFYIGKIGKGDFDYDVSWEQSEGNAAAVRTLIDMGLIELFGKHYGIAHEACINPRGVVSSKATKKDTEPSIEPPRLSAHTNNAKGFYRPGEIVRLSVTSNEDGYLYCYYSMLNGSIVQIYPNRYIPDPFINANRIISIPGDDRLSITAEPRKPGVGGEKLNCLFSRDDISQHSNIKFGTKPISGTNIDSTIGAITRLLPAKSFTTSSTEIIVR